MELKVWVEGIQRIVCGVTVNTTCQDVVFALAHATGKVGRFTLIERWRNNERHLAPNENPLKLLLKWGEYANDVQFILQRSESKQQQQQQKQQRTDSNFSNLNNSGNNSISTKKPLGISNNNNNNNNINNTININDDNNNSNDTSRTDGLSTVLQKQQEHNLSSELNFKSKEIKKSFGAYDARQIENIGIVKGIPQQQKQHPAQHSANNNSVNSKISASIANSATTTTTATRSTYSSPKSQIKPKHEKSISNPIDTSSTQTIGAYNDLHQYEFNSNGSDSNSKINMLNKLETQHSKSINEINLAEVRNLLDRRTLTAGSPTELRGSNTNNLASTNNSSCCKNSSTNTRTNTNNNIAINSNRLNNNNNNNLSHENLLDIYGATTPYNASPDLYKQTPMISANGALVPPPYRDPPPPRNSPLSQPQQQQQYRTSSAETASTSSSSIGGGGVVPNISTNPFLNDYNSSNDYDYVLQTFGNNNGSIGTNSNMLEETSDSIFQATQYNELLQLIKFQREKISTQQMELTKYDAEIVFLENKERDQAQELEAISREITKADQIFRQGSEQLQTLQYVEEENELVKQQEKTLKSEIALLRSKLSNCETELLQCKNKMRLLMDDIEIEQRAITQKQKNNRQNVERDFLIEMERIQIEIDQALRNTETSNKTAENLKKEILLIENAIAEKKRQVEQLVNEMKEVNLQSLTVTTTEEIKHLLEGPSKPGSSRRIIGSPRQLENAVPTSKNPHGVWV